MWAYIVRRIFMIIPVMVLVALIVFSLLYLVPGDAASILAGDLASPEDVERIREQLNLDEPIYIQFVKWVWSLLHGDLGESVFYQLPVSRLMLQRLQPTLTLAIGTIIVSVALSLPAGIIAAFKAGKWADRVTMAFSVLGFSMPIFVVGYLFIFIFSFKLNWFPIQGYVALSEGILPWIRSVTLPCLTLGVVYAALIARITRATMVEVLTQDYIRMAYAKGMPLRIVLIRHALRNAAVPIITIIGLTFVVLLSGVVVTETVFNIPGIGRLVVDAISQRDYPIIRSVLFVFSWVYVLINLVIDIIYSLVDPRIQY
ncbi:MAG: ABC transporter permease [Deltaproteobacteria bacterium]|nr:ABC transporter permease [Deltaproteobacteria bacterium]